MDHSITSREAGEGGWKWQAVYSSVSGAAHARAGKKSQDAVRCLNGDGMTSPLIVALCDGHGSLRHFRSERGAAGAAATALQVIPRFLDRRHDTAPSALVHMLREELPRTLVHTWASLVRADIEEEPFEKSRDYEMFQERAGAAAVESVRANPLLAYGTTLLAVAVTEQFILYVQLGDGDILTVSDNGKEVMRPLPADERLLGNETTSLCLPDAAGSFRIGFQPLPEPAPPALIVLCTDGVSNSFAQEAGFFQVGSDLLRTARQEGLETVENGLEAWLREASERGSGDDATLGILCRLDALNQPAEGDAAGPGGSVR